MMRNRPSHVAILCLSAVTLLAPAESFSSASTSTSTSLGKAALAVFRTSSSQAVSPLERPRGSFHPFGGLRRTTLVGRRAAARKGSEYVLEENLTEVSTSATTTTTSQDESSDGSTLDSASLLNATNMLLDAEEEEDQPMNRRIFFASSLVAAGAALAASQRDNLPSFDVAPPASSPESLSQLQWEVTPVNKRTGVTVFDAEAAGYNVRFVTYLARYLLSYDSDCQQWWLARAKDIPRLANENEIETMRNAQFAAFAASVEVGLQDYRSSDGPARLLRSLLQKYGPTATASVSASTDTGENGGVESSRAERERTEARRQLALLFGLLEKNQPVEEINKLLASIDNGSLTSGVEILNPGAGYAPGYGPPLVTFPAPEAEGYERATGRAILTPNGRILRIDIVNRGAGYKSPPTVTIAPPAALETGAEAEEATARAIIFRSGPHKGCIDRIELTNPGYGYSNNEIIKVRLGPPEENRKQGGIQATATAVREYKVARIEMTSNGTGYAVEKPIYVKVEPPPPTARINMNDRLMVSRVLAAEGIDSKTQPNNGRDMIGAKISNAASRKISGCTGRECYDEPVVAVAYPRSEKGSSYKSNLQDFERGKYISGTGNAGAPLDIPKFTFSTTTASSQRLLNLIPGGVGLVFNEELDRYVLAVDPNDIDSVARLGRFSTNTRTTYQTFDPDFGPRARTPIERDMQLEVGAFLRFVASGAICCSGVHLALTPIDVVKTRVQTDPENYPSVTTGFQRVLEEGGVSEFFRGWAPTFVGFFFWGGVAYSVTEFLRRSFQAILIQIPDAPPNLEVPVILVASGLAAMIGSLVICPFEAVRIRSVAQPDYAPNIVAVAKRMVVEEGLGTLVSAVPVFMAKEIPFAMAKFTVFDISTAWLYATFPTAKEDLRLSLLVSLIGGTIGGIAAAIVSNPADATISEMKKSKNDMSPIDAAKVILEKDGVSGLFRGLPLRFVFYSLMVSMQFLIYDAVRYTLGVGSDDLKLYLDVLGGVLREVDVTGPPIT